MEKVKEGKYFKLNGDIHILNAIPKTNLNALFHNKHKINLKLINSKILKRKHRYKYDLD